MKGEEESGAELLENVETHFAKGDAAAAAKQGKLKELVKEKFFK